jgi:hypothetical protein
MGKVGPEYLLTRVAPPHRGELLESGAETWWILAVQLTELSL